MLFDSYPHITAAFEKMMAENGKTIDFDQAKSLFEISFADAFGFYNTSESERKVFQQYEHDYSLEPVAVPFKNTEAALRGVIASGGRNFLYTHRGASVYYYLKKYELYELFDFYVTSENGFPSKPAPDAVEFIVKENSLIKSETVMIGDREIDVMAGKNAGVYGCLYTKNPKETNADFVITDIIQVLDI